MKALFAAVMATLAIVAIFAARWGSWSVYIVAGLGALIAYLQLARMGHGRDEPFTPKEWLS